MANRLDRVRVGGRLRDYDMTDAESKLSYNRRVFHVVAPRYNLATRLLAFGQDQRWKRQLVRTLPLAETVRALDLACGTGDLTLHLTRRFARGFVIGIDIDDTMLATARERLRRAGRVNFRLVQADMTRLPFHSSRFDVVTGGYALRNAPDLVRVLGEIHRVLEPGGFGAVLEFRRSPKRRAAAVQLRLLSGWGKFWGLVLHGNPDVYGYIAESLRHFPDAGELDRLLAATGFSSVRRRTLMFGLLAIVRFRKPLRPPGASATSAGS
jgi:ubiquinone/menaquinone biosynthesis methyltransferase